MLVDAPFVWTVTASAVLMTGALTVRRRPGWIVAMAVSTTGGMAFAVAAYTATRLWNPIGYRWPDSFAVWAALPVFAVLLGVQGWSGASAGYKAAALVAPVLGVAFTLSQINAHYAYVRTVTALAGDRGVRDRAGPRQFAKLQARTVVPAQLP